MTSDDRPVPSLPPPDAYRTPSPARRWGGLPLPRAGPLVERPVHEEPVGTALAERQAPPIGTGFQRNTWAKGFAAALAVFVLLQVGGLGILLAVEPDPSDRTEILASLIITLILDVVALVAVPLWVTAQDARGPTTARDGPGATTARDGPGATTARDGPGAKALARSAAALGLRRPTLRAIGWGLLGLALAYIVLGLYVGLVDLLGIDALEPDSTIDDDTIYESAGLVGLTGALAVLVAPVAEEVFYRGFLVGALGRRFGLATAVLASALLFAAVHLDAGSLIPFALIGVVFAFVYVRSRSLTSAILAHFLFNAIAYAATVADRGVG